MLEVCLLGTGGMVPLPERWLTALMVRFQGSSILIDCGEGTQIAIKEKGWSFKPIDVICFTHYHADHISGLPGLLLTMGNAGRTEPVTLIGPAGLEKVVTALRVIAPELPFELNYLELEQPCHLFEREGYLLSAFRAEHGVPCYGYSITVCRAGKFQVEKAIELGVPKQDWGRLQKGEAVAVNGKIIQPDLVLGKPRKGIKLAYCTDSRPVDSIAEAARNADLFICEGMYGEEEKREKAIEYKHMTFREAAELAKKADVKSMWLTHFSPSLTEPEKYIQDVRSIFFHSEIGKDGQTVKLEFETDRF